MEVLHGILQYPAGQPTFLCKFEPNIATTLCFSMAGQKFDLSSETPQCISLDYLKNFPSQS
jgi:hypothetical protein